ncbi:metal-dependent hydrolase [Desulfotomaculum copahuensis]|uniref:Metal-dependent hydrolase n=1 Tax=Desulfotomaculum copahuensis TaxID=1838280 RepID=A0A1B7LG40_9FIRM|nr:metal-dependent hydrolase [Desulfotomaculum copahuensis]OAT83712.1 metal-dependent hydrolase [Desulfotomaculum copahuensis]
MLWRTHFLAGAAAGLLLAGHADIKTAAMTAGVAGLAALLPDLDSPQSKVGRMVPVISWAIKKAVGHRGPLHSLAGAVVAGLLAFAGLKMSGLHYGLAVPLAAAAGYVSHLVMDSFNPQGVPWLWPLEAHFGLPLVRTGGLLEHLAVTPAMLVLCGWLIWKTTV